MGAMQILSGNQRRHGVDDVSLATELAVRTALAIDTARLYRARDDMMSVVSHDLRNPLNVIGFAVASLKRPNINDDQRAGYVDKVRRAADRMNRLIEDLLDVGRLEAGRLPMERGAQPSASLVIDAIDAMRALADEKKVKLAAGPMDKLPSVSADRERVLQVFSNLIGNALKFTPDGGTITLRAEASGNEVHFTVADTGPGIKKEDIGRIFDRFWQARRRDRQGAGLGLTIVKGIVAAHGGRIWAESDVGKGAVFHFTLPIAAETRHVAEDRPSTRGFVRAAARSR
jgi:signal transduction histidine kinase